MKADDYGRFHADPRLVRALCFPLSETVKSAEVKGWLAMLENRGLIVRYEAQGLQYLAILDFGQRLRTSHAKFPQMDGQEPNWLPTRRDLPQLAADCGDLPQLAATSRLKGKEYENEYEEENEEKSLEQSAKPDRSRHAAKSNIPDDEFIAELKRHYPGIDVDRELSKMDAWLLTKPGKHKTRRFVVNWLNRTDPGMKINGNSAAERDKAKTGLDYKDECPRL
jgi:hypothetical protein